MSPFAGFLLKLFGLLDWCLPRGLVRKASVDRIRARIFVAVAFLPLASSFLYLVSFSQPHPSVSSASHLAIQAALSVMALAYIRMTGRFRSGAFIYLVSVQILACINIVDSNSIHSVYYPWLMVHMIVAVLILETASAIWICLIYLLTTLLTIHGNADHGINLPSGQTLHSFTQAKLYMLLAAEGTLIIISLLFENFRRRKQESFLHQRNKISQSLGVYALGEMVGGVSHEVNNPLAIAMGLLMQYEKIAMQTNGPGEIQDMQEKLDRSLQRIRYVVEGLKTFSQGELDEAIEERSVRSICGHLLVLNQERLVEQNVRLRFTDWTGNLQFFCRPHQLIRTLQGLLANAIEASASEEFPDVELKIFREGAQLILQVIDNGSGIPMDLRHRVFEPFFSTKVIKAGQGLTLAISKGMIEAQGGQMSYQPLPRGSCFTIHLPIDLSSPHGVANDSPAFSFRKDPWKKLLNVFGIKSRSLYPAR